MKSKKSALIISIVLTLGLISCDQDNHSEALPKKIKDRIDMTPVIVHENNSHHNLSDSLNIPLDSKVVFKELRAKESTKISVFSHCKNGLQEVAVEGSINMDSVAEGIPIFDIIPAEVLSPGTIDIQCNFKFDFKNDIGSKTSILIEASILSPTRPLPLQPFSDIDIQTHRRWKIGELSKHTLSTEIGDGVLYFQCQNFSKIFRIGENISPPKIADIFALEEITNPDGLRCQVVMQNETIPLGTKVSPSFIIHPNIIPPIIHQDWFFKPSKPLMSGENIQLAKLEIKNTNSQKIVIKLGSLLNTKYHIQAIMTMRTPDHLYYVDRSRSFDVQWEMNSPVLKATNDFKFIELQPHQAVTLVATGAPAYNCIRYTNNPDGLNPNCFHHKYLHGMASHFSGLPQVWYNYWGSSRAERFVKAIDWNTTKTFRNKKYNGHSIWSALKPPQRCPSAPKTWFNNIIADQYLYCD